MSIRDWFKKAKAQKEQPSDAEAFFRKAVSQINAGNEPEALLGFSRVLQLMPDNEQALVWREKLARELGLTNSTERHELWNGLLIRIVGRETAGKLNCVEMYAFRPHQPPEPYNAALLDLCQTPPLSLSLRSQRRNTKSDLWQIDPWRGCHGRAFQKSKPRAFQRRRSR